MSVISDITDGMLVRLEAIYPSHFRLQNPYDASDNPDQLRDIGFGIAQGPATNTQRLLSCQLSVRRDLNIILTRGFFSTEIDRDTMFQTEQQLLEDQFLLLKDVEGDPKLGLSATLPSFIGAQYVGDGGVEFVQTETNHFLFLSTTIQVEYLENLT